MQSLTTNPALSIKYPAPFWLILLFPFLIRAQETGLSGDRLQRIFKLLDRNSDGVVTVEEAPKRADFIRSADEDKSGGATLIELQKWVKKNSPPKPDPDAKPQVIAAKPFPDNAPVTPKQCAAAAWP